MAKFQTKLSRLFGKLCLCVDGWCWSSKASLCLRLMKIGIMSTTLLKNPNRVTISSGAKRLPKFSYEGKWTPVQIIVFNTGFPGPKNLTNAKRNETSNEVKMTIRAIKSSFMTFICFQTQRSRNLMITMVAKVIPKNMKIPPLTITFTLQNQNGRGPTITRK